MLPRRTGRPAFTLLELIVVLLVLGILAAIAVPTFQRVKENSVVRAAQTALEAAARNGEAIAKSDPDSTDEQIAASVESEFTDEGGLEVSVGSGADADKVTVSQTNGSITASGTVEFNGGVATITDATLSGGGGSGGSSSTTSTTVAPTTTTTQALSLSYADTEFVLNGAAETLNPTVNGGTAASFSVDGTLPRGVFFDTTTGAFSTNGIVNVSDGSFDLSFATGTDTTRGANGEVKGVAVQPDGKIVLVGAFSRFNSSTNNAPRIVRLNADGSVDTGFTPGTGPNFGVEAVALQPDGKILIGGSFTSVAGTARNRIARLNADGSLDLSFDPGSGFPDTVTTLALQSDGRVVVAGHFLTFNGTARNRLARLNADGSLDLSFAPTLTGSSIFVENVAVEADDEILLSGMFSAVDGVARDRVARLNADGSLDTGFVPDLSTILMPGGSVIYDAAPQPDGKVVIAGEILGYVVRLTATGAVDPTFSRADRDFDGSPFALQVLRDGTIIAAGGASVWTGEEGGPGQRRGVFRFNHDGSLDTTFGSDLFDPSGTVNDIAVQADGRVVIVGNFGGAGDPSDVDGTGRRFRNVARLSAAAPTGFPASLLVTVTAADGRSTSSAVSISLG